MILLLAVLAALLGGFFLYEKRSGDQKSQGEQSVSTTTVKRMDITSELTASSSLSPKDTYEVTSLVEGEVIEANFEEGDVVEKGQILYRIDASSMDSDLSSAQTSLQRAKESAQTAQSDYTEETARLAGNTYRSTASGYIRTLYIKEGDKVNNGTKIADLYDDSVMKITVPFLSGEAAEINVGDEAAVTLEDTGEQISGTVTVVSSMEETLSGGRLVKNVTVEVPNPGGLTTDTAASVKVDGFVCSAEGTFTAKTETTLSVELSGNKSLEIEKLLIHEGSYVEKNSELFQVTAKTAEEYLKEFKDAVESADDNLENAENKLSNTQDSVDDYTITAPISGTVITKNVKVGDKISKSSSGNRVYVKKNSGSGKSGGSNVPDGFEAVQVTTGIINDDYVEILSGLSEGDEVYISSDSGSSTQTNQMQMGGMGGPGGDMGGGAPGGPGGNSGNGGGNGGGRRSQ